MRKALLISCVCFAGVTWSLAIYYFLKGGYWLLWYLTRL